MGIFPGWTNFFYSVHASICGVSNFGICICSLCWCICIRIPWDLSHKSSRFVIWQSVCALVFVIASHYVVSENDFSLYVYPNVYLTSTRSHSVNSEHLWKESIQMKNEESKRKTKAIFHQVIFYVICRTRITQCGDRMKNFLSNLLLVTLIKNRSYLHRSRIRPTLVTGQWTTNTYSKVQYRQMTDPRREII